MSFIYLLLSFYNEVHITNIHRKQTQKTYCIQRIQRKDEKYLQKLFIIIKSWEYFEEKFEVENLFDIDNKIFFNKMKNLILYFNIQVNSVKKH